MDDGNKIVNDYISTQNKNFDFYFINCEVVIEFDKNSSVKLKTNCFSKTDIININLYLLYYIDFYESRGYKFYNINQMTINIISDRCDMSYEIYINQPMHSVERRLNMRIARNPQLINLFNRNKNHPLITKYSHIPF